MYMLKSEVIGQIQSYHKQLARLYLGLFERAENEEIKLLIHDLYRHEQSRDIYLEKHKKIARAMNCWLDLPSERISDQISACFADMQPGPGISMSRLLDIELHFDHCLIKLYTLLFQENALSETMYNIFYYMLKKTKREEATLAEMVGHSQNDAHYGLSEGWGQLFH